MHSSSSNPDPRTGDCTAQILLATNFNDVPHDQTSWINLIGPARILLRQCAGANTSGGLLVRNGTSNDKACARPPVD